MNKMSLEMLFRETIHEAIDKSCELLQKRIKGSASCETGLQEMMNERYFHGYAHLAESLANEKQNVLFHLSKLLIGKSILEDEDMVYVLCESSSLYAQGILSKEETISIELLVDRIFTDKKFARDTEREYCKFKEYLLDKMYN